ncbi:MAG: carboxyl transferase [Ruminococcus sp.]|nr:carboxyl transferase [Ruminococcus sp.]
MSDSIINLVELKAKAEADSAARTRLTYLFDEGTFTELDPYVTSDSDLSGVITAYGYVEGNPVYAFSQDINVKKGALTEAQAKKIVKVYDLAAKTGVPVVGIYDSFGADLSNGCKALNSYGELLMWMSNLSGVVPQISVVAGTCAGTAAMLAESADFVIVAEDSELFAASNSEIKNSAENAAKNGTAAVVAKDDKEAVEAAKNILLKLPQNNLSPVPMYEFELPETVFGGDAVSQTEAVCDEGSVIELSDKFGKASYTALGSIGGATVGVVATNKTTDKLNSDDCTKIARFVRICDSYAIPVITLVDTEGFEANTETEASGAVRDMTKLAHAYAEATTIKISVVTGNAYGPAFIALAGKGANADLVYALEDAVISPLSPVTAVEFLEHDQLKGADDLTSARNALADKYAKEKANAAIAAQNGCVDNVVASAQLRDALVNSIEIMAGKRISRLPKKHSNIQL